MRTQMLPQLQRLAWLPLASRPLVRSSLRAASTSQDGEPFHALMIGAGYAMFGTPEGDWNMSRRLENRVGRRLVVDAVLDPDRERAETALRLKMESAAIGGSYGNTVVLPDLAEFKKKVDEGQAHTPKAIFVATPPLYRGGLASPRDVELQITKLFPKAHIFLEKPVATCSPWEKSVIDAKEVGKRLQKHDGIVSIGYVLRYREAVKKIKKIIEENNLNVMATSVRMVTAYELAIKTDWWNKSISEGPIVEQATHICDLARYFGGDVENDTIAAHAVEAHEKPGYLTKRNFDESKIPDDLRIPRATTASWKYTNGGVGMMMHAIALHGVDYSVELQVYADGYEFSLTNIWVAPTLHIRKPGSDIPEIFTFPGDDAYQTEMNHFIDAIEGGENPVILSTYEDAAKSYEMTWYIRNSSEETTKKMLARYGKAI